LDTWERVIEKLTNKIKIKKNTRRSLMQKLLTGDVRLTGFTDKWQAVKLIDLGNTYAGIMGKGKDDFGSGKAFITYMNIYSSSSINPDNCGFVKIDDGENQNKAKYGDIFFTTSSETPDEVGISSVLLDKNARELYLNSFCFGFRLSDFKILTPEFSQFYFRGQKFRKQMTRIAQGASRYNLSKRYFLDTTIEIPSSINEQNAIADILRLADKEIADLEKKLSILKDQKKYLLNNLITGTIRTKA
jgi:type I restriction enzyme S subunit